MKAEKALASPASSKQIQDDETMLAMQMEEMLINADILPARPSYGGAGHPILLDTNYFIMDINADNPDQLLHKYELDITPLGSARLTTSKSHRLVEILLERPTFKSLQPGVATNYSNKIFTTQRVSVGNDVIAKGFPKFAPLEYFEPGEDPRNDPRKYQITISYIGAQSVSELIKKVASLPDESNPTYDRDSLVHDLNIIINSTPSQDRTTYAGGRRTKFFKWEPNSQLDLGSGLIANRGYYSSVRVSSPSVMVNVHGCVSAFYKNVKLSQLMDEFANSADGKAMVPGALEGFLDGLKVTTNYLREEAGNKPITRVRTIKALAKDRASSHDVRFTYSRDGREKTVNVAEYFQTRKINIYSSLNRRAHETLRMEADPHQT